MKKYNIEYDKIVTEDLKPLIDKITLTTLKEIAKLEKYNLESTTINYTQNIYRQVESKPFINAKAYNRIYYSSKYQNISIEQKAIISANIIFNDNKFISYLCDSPFSSESIKEYLKIIKSCKKILSTRQPTEKEEKYITAVEKFTDKLSIYFAQCVGKVNSTIIINKLNEINSFNPELLEYKNTRIKNKKKGK